MRHRIAVILKWLVCVWLFFEASVWYVYPPLPDPPVIPPLEPYASAPKALSRVNPGGSPRLVRVGCVLPSNYFQQLDSVRASQYPPTDSLP
jgi:hypothetical protein